MLKSLKTNNLTHKNLRADCIHLAAGKPFDSVKISGFEGGFPFGKKNTRATDLFYLSPEALIEKYADNSDVWSIGVLAYVILSGTPISTKQSAKDLMQSVSHGAFEFHDPVWFSVSLEAKDFITQACRKDPKFRLSLDSALEHKWIASTSNEKGKQIKKKTLQSLKNF